MLLLGLALLPAVASADQSWVKATSTNFEVYTTAGEPKAREAALYFEHVNSFLVKALGTTRSGQGRVRVIVFQSAREYKPYQPGEGRLAYAGGIPGSDQIVMQGMAPDQYFIAVHEYVHILLKPFKKAPLWFNEGLAQVYQTLRPAGGKIIVGDLIPGALDYLDQAKWLDLETLCAVDRNSPYYTGDNSHAGIFYTESWLLTHMLFAGRKYGAGFSELKRQILAGTPAEEAFQSAFGETMWHVYSDLRRYAEGGEYRGHIFDVAIAQQVEKPEIKPVTPIESDLILARLLAEIGKTDEARQALKKLAEQEPTSPEIHEALGFVAWLKQDKDEARAQFAKAIELGSKNARVYHGYSALEAQAGQPRERQIELLRKAVDLDPEYQDARLRLGYLLVAASDYAGALAQLERVKEGDAENPFQFFREFAYACYRTGDKERARANAKRALAAAQGQEQKASAEQLVAMIEGHSPDTALPDLDTVQRPTIRRAPGASAPAQRRGRATIEGTFDRIDCQGTTARIRLTADGHVVRLLIDKPDSIEVRGQSSAFTVTCGPQQPPRRVRIEYEPRADEEAGTIGLVRVVEMK
jgi:tetratricopeptide (TPR) repeat protein